MATSVSQYPRGRYASSRNPLETRVVARYLITKPKSSAGSSSRASGTSWDTTPRAPLDGTILHEARHIARQAATPFTGQQQWGEEKLASTKELIGRDGYSGTIGLNVFAYHIAPPVCDESGPRRRVLDEWIWDEPVRVREDEIYATAELEDFVGSDFDCCWDVHSLPGLDRTSAPLHAPSTEAHSQRYRLDISSLPDAIPEPHVLSTYDATKKLVDLEFSSAFLASLAPYNASPPFAIQTQTEQPTEGSRSAWVIPIRGALIWEQASRADIILNPSSDTEQSSDSLAPCLPPTRRVGSDNNTSIIWTRRSIRAFWEYLVSLHSDLLKGQIGLSFHCPKRPQQALPPSPPTFVTIELPSVLSAASQLSDLTITDPQRLKNITHIKVYHEREHTMRIRGILHEWEYDEGTGEKRRPLEGAKLALVDERSKGVLVC